MKTLAEHRYSWCYDNAGFDQLLTLETDDQKVQFKQEIEANGFCYLLELKSLPQDPANVFAPLDNLPLKEAKNLLRGEGYGADLRSVAKFLGLEYGDYFYKDEVETVNQNHLPLG